MKANKKQHTMAKYFMEMTLHDANFSSMNPSVLAASALSLAFKIFSRTDRVIYNKFLLLKDIFSL